MIELLSIKLENFLSHKDTEIKFTSNKDLVLIEGKNSDGRYDSNGSGKSSILEGLVYVLSGNTLRGVGVADVVNRQAGKDTRVTLNLKVEGTSYTVTRHRAHTTAGDSLVLTREGEDISKRLNKDTQSDLDSILGVSYKVLTSVLFLGEGLSAKFTQLSDPDKKALIESTLNLSHDFNEVRERVNRELRGVKSSIDTETGKSDGIKRVLEGVDPSNNISLEEITNLSSEIESTNLEYAKLYADYQKVSSDISLLTSTIREYETSLIQLRSQESQLSTLDEKIESVKSKSDPICPQCKQSISDPKTKERVLYDLSKQRDLVEDNLKPIRESVSKVRDINVAKETSATLNSQLSTLSETLNRMHTENTNRSNLKSSLEAKKSVYDQLTQYEKELESLREKLVHLDSNLKDLNYLYSLFSPTGLLVYILGESVQYINERLRVYSSVLLDKSYEIVFKKGKISLLDSGGSTYQSLSNGEKRRLDIAIQFSLHDYVTTYCGKGIDTIFIDEVLDTLDSVGVRNIIEVLRMKLDYCNSTRIYLITHNNDIKSQVDSFITISKDSEGISRLLEEVA